MPDGCAAAHQATEDAGTESERRQVLAFSGLLDPRPGDGSVWDLIAHALSA